jgi:hypothetical protein
MPVPTRSVPEAKLLMRTTRETVTFDRPFSLRAVEGVQPAETYMVEVHEDLIEGLSFRAGCAFIAGTGLAQD